MQDREKASVLQNTYAVILVRPEHHENIGLVARNMKNTGFEDLRLVGVTGLEEKAFVAAVHSREILESARFFASLKAATADCEVVFASTAKARKNFSHLPLEEAIRKMHRFPSPAKIGLCFGNERTGLTSDELQHSNFRFMIPQATRQPSYNLASAVILTLFRLFSHENAAFQTAGEEMPLSRHEQEECIERILSILAAKRFYHATNKTHVQEMIYDLFGRLALTERDRNLLLAIFAKGVD